MQGCTLNEDSTNDGPEFVKYRSIKRMPFIAKRLAPKLNRGVGDGILRNLLKILRWIGQTFFELKLAKIFLTDTA